MITNALFNQTRKIHKKWCNKFKLFICVTYIYSVAFHLKIWLYQTYIGALNIGDLILYDMHILWTVAIDSTCAIKVSRLPSLPLKTSLPHRTLSLSLSLSKNFSILLPKVIEKKKKQSFVFVAFSSKLTTLLLVYFT